MRTLNATKSKEDKLTVPIKNPAFQDDDERYPCWYANLETGSNRKDYKWRVGCKYQGQTNEYAFRVSKAGNIKDDKSWYYLTGADFAISLIKKFKTGGEKEIKQWIKNGCQ